MREAAEFYTTRVLKEYKDKCELLSPLPHCWLFLFWISRFLFVLTRDETHKEWAKSFPTVLQELQEFVKKYHTTGVVWGGKVRFDFLFLLFLLFFSCS